MHRQIQPTEYRRLRELLPFTSGSAAPRGVSLFDKSITLTSSMTEGFNLTTTGRILSCIDQDLCNKSQGWQHSWT